MSPDRTPLWPTMSIEERTQQYSPSSMLDGPLDLYIDQYARRSADAYAEAGLVRTLSYGPLQSTTIDVALPAGASADRPAPLHLFIHGGYWRQLSKRESFFLAKPCNDRGQAFAAVDYTLAPEADLDQIVGECNRAMLALREAGVSGQLPIDSEHITISGSSAGAHLAAMVASRLHPSSKPAAAILVSGIYDLEPLIATYVNEPLGLDTAAAHHHSPCRQSLRWFPSTVVAWGENETDEFKRQSRMFADLVRAAGSQVVETEVANRNHFDVVFDIIPTLTDLLPS